jgi:hypothetical protein
MKSNLLPPSSKQKYTIGEKDRQRGWETANGRRWSEKYTEMRNIFELRDGFKTENRLQDYYKGSAKLATRMYMVLG